VRANAQKLVILSAAKDLLLLLLLPLPFCLSFPSINRKALSRAKNGEDLLVADRAS